MRIHKQENYLNMMQSSTDHNRYLKECFRLAAISAEQGESSVGALLVKDNTVLGKGTEQSRARGDVTAMQKWLPSWTPLHSTAQIAVKVRRYTPMWNLVYCARMLSGIMRSVGLSM